MISILVEALGDESVEVRRKALEIVRSFKESAIGELIKGLRSEKVIVRQESARLLGELKAVSSVDVLMEVVRSDKDWSVRRTAVESLGTIGDPQAIPVLVKALGDADTNVKNSVKSVLRSFKDTSVIELIKGLKDEKTTVRIESASLLGELKVTSAVDALGEVVQSDKEVSVRKVAVEALETISDSRAIPGLVVALGDTDSGVRNSARSVLKNFKNAAVPELIKGLKSEKVMVRKESASLLGELKAVSAVEGLMEIAYNDEEWSVRQEAARALGEIGDQRAIPALLRVAGDEWYGGVNAAIDALKKFKEGVVIEEALKGLKSENEEIREGSAVILGKLKAGTAVEELMEGVKEDTVKEEAVWALGEIGDDRAIPILLAVAGSNGWLDGEGIAAISALKKFDKKKVIEESLKGLKSENWSVGEGSAMMLGELKAVEAVEPLMEVVISKEGIIFRRKAIEALGKIGDERAISVLLVAVGEISYEYTGTVAVNVLKEFKKEIVIKEALNGLKSESEYMRRGSAVVLGDLKAIEAVDLLIEIMLRVDERGLMKSAVAEALGKIGEERAIPVLVTALGDDRLRSWDGMRSVREALKQFKKEAVVGELLKGLKSDNWEIRYQSTRILGELKAMEAVDSLIETVRGDKETLVLVREAAAWALGKIGDRRAVNPLTTVLNDPSESVSAEAALALGTIGDKSAIKPLLDMVLANQGQDTSKLHWWAAVTALREIKGEYQSPILKRTIEENVTVPVGGIISPVEFKINSEGYNDGWSIGFWRATLESNVQEPIRWRDLSWTTYASNYDGGAPVDINSNTILQISGHEGYLGRGYRIIVVNEKTGEVERVGHFDLWIDGSKRAAKLMADFINEIPEGRIVLVGVIDEGSMNLTPEAIKAMESLGSTLINRIGFRDSFALIGRKGAKPGNVIEFLAPSQWGTVTVSTKAAVAKYYDAQGNLIFTDVY